MRADTGSAVWLRQVALLLVLLGASGLWLVMQHSPRDRWGRTDSELAPVSGSPSTPLLLVNSGTIPIYFEISHPDWEEPQPELLLPGDTQFVDVPSVPAKSALVRAMPLDLQARGATRVIDLPTGWQFTAIDVDEDGAVVHEAREGGDTSPRRGMVVISSRYALPIHVDVPWDAHERPPGADAERRSWIGPGTGDDIAGCAFALDRATSATLRVPTLDAPTQTFVISPADGATRIALAYDGTLQRDNLPLWRRFTHLASF
jgi:hypothetical protein